MTDKTLKEHIKKYNDLKTQADALTALLDAEKKSIIAEFTSRDIDTYNTAKYAVKLAKFITTRLDSTALKADAPETYNKYLKSVNQTRFTVKAI